jgi:type II restriction enzyme
MKYQEIEELFDDFSASVDEPFSQLGVFLNDKIKPRYYQEKEEEYKKKGLPPRDSHNKARQSWVVFLGRILEKLIVKSLEDFCEEHKLEVTTDKHLRQKNLDKKLDLVRRAIEVHFGEYSLLPDADIVIYRYQANEGKVKVLAILSVKNSFRERYTETPYWKLKLKENPNTRTIKVFMVTPDNDNEVSFINRGNRGPRKARIVMEYDLDGIYLAKEDFDSSDRVKNISDLVVDLKELVEE